MAPIRFHGDHPSVTHMNTDKHFAGQCTHMHYFLRNRTSVLHFSVELAAEACINDMYSGLDGSNGGARGMEKKT